MQSEIPVMEQSTGFLHVYQLSKMIKTEYWDCFGRLSASDHRTCNRKGFLQVPMASISVL